MPRSKDFFKATYPKPAGNLEEHEYFQRALDEGMFPPVIYYSRNYPTSDVIQCD